MKPILKDPDAVLSYAIRWPGAVLDGAAIMSADWRIEPDEDGGLNPSAAFVDGSETGARFGGGIAGQLYRATCRISLSDGRSADRSLLLRVEQQ